MRLPQTLAAVLLCLSACYADPPQILQVPPKEPNKWVEVPAAGEPTLTAGVPIALSTGDVACNWIAIDSGVTLFVSVDGKSVSIGSPTEGRFRFVVIGKDGVPALTAITFGKPKPIPPVPQPPGPNPPDPPNSAIARFVIVEDTSIPGTWRGTLLGSQRIRSFLSQLAKAAPDPIHSIIDINDKASTDPEVKEYQAKAVGKTLPWIWMLDINRKPVKDQAMPKDEDAFIAAFDVHLGDRKLGLKAGMPKLKWTNFGSTPTTPLIPRSEWKAINLGGFCPPVHDQDGIGQCASSAACGVLEWAEAVAGQPYVYLSAGDLYGRPAVNGGSDNGSLLEDNLAELLTNGVATAKSVPYVWNRRMWQQTPALKAERDRHKLSEVYLCPNFDAMASAIMQGFVVEHGMMWRDGFRVQSDGWLSGATGGQGGHAQFGYGLEPRGDGTWGVITQNSWSATWGGSKDGRIKAGSSIIHESLFGTQIGGFFAVRAAKQTAPDLVKFGKMNAEFPLAP